MARCELGCFNRPWHQETLEDALAGMAAAGFTLAGYMRQQGEDVLAPDSPAGRAAEVSATTSAAGLAPSTLLASMRLGESLEDACNHFRSIIDCAADVGAKYVLTCGTMDDDLRGKYCDIVRGTLDHATAKGVIVTLKPHGGISATSRELVAVHDEIDHPTFGIYYDPGNIHYYTGESAAEDVKLVADRAVAMCIKDNTDGKLGDVAIEPGTGEVDFDAVFGTLLDAGFDGPCIVECLGGKTLAEVNESAKRTHEFLMGHVG